MDFKEPKKIQGESGMIKKGSANDVVVYDGPMYSGKSREIEQYVVELIKQKKCAIDDILIIQHSFHQGEKIFKSRDNEKTSYPCQFTGTVQGILDIYKKWIKEKGRAPKVFVLDEAWFFCIKLEEKTKNIPEEFLKAVNEIRKKSTVLIGMLNETSDGVGTPLAEALKNNAERNSYKIHKLKASCVLCKAKEKDTFTRHTGHIRDDGTSKTEKASVRGKANEIYYPVCTYCKAKNPTYETVEKAKEKVLEMFRKGLSEEKERGFLDRYKEEIGPRRLAPPMKV